MFKSAFTLILAALVLSLNGCLLFRDNIQQGNVLDRHSFQQIHPGMNRAQVQYLVGNPVLTSTFNDNRWDYVYMTRRGSHHPSMQHVSIFFKNNQVTRIDWQNRPTSLKPKQKNKR